uniref:Nodulin-like domain-containing protein n=1 Tax=Craspedostauros australis TaxID=1486917 RepID=A0A7R9WXL3_9STRA
MFYSAMLIAGNGTLITNSASAIVESRMLPSDLTSVATSIFSVAQSGSRVFTGFLTEVAATHYKPSKDDGDLAWLGWHSRPLFLSMGALIAAVAHIILAIPGLGSAGFIVGVTLSGLAYGTIWPLMVLVVGDVFGKTNLGAIYLWFDGSTVALGTLLISKMLSQYIYEQHRVHPDSSGAIADAESSTCFGEECFQMTHIITAILCLTAFVTPFELARRTHKHCTD